MNKLPDVTSNITIYACADDTTLKSKSDWASYSRQQLELVSELEFELQDCGLMKEVAC